MRRGSAIGARLGVGEVGVVEKLLHRSERSGASSGGELEVKRRQEPGGRLGAEDGANRRAEQGEMRRREPVDGEKRVRFGGECNDPVDKRI